MEGINQEVDICFTSPETVTNPVTLHVKFDSHDSRSQEREELEEIYDESTRQWTLPDNHYWSDSASRFIKEQKPGMLVLNTLSPRSDIETISYFLPDAPEALRSAYESDPYVVACGLSFASIPDGPIKDGLIKLRKENAYNWNDPANEELSTRVKEIFFDKSRQSVFKFGVRLALLTYAPWLMPAEVVTRTGIPFKDYIAKQTLPLGKATTFLADKSPIDISPEVVSFIHRWSHFPVIATKDIDLQRAFMSLKAADAIEITGQDSIPGEVYALLPDYEKRGKYLVNDPDEQEKIARAGVEQFFSIFNDISKASNTLISPELRKELVQIVSTYFGSFEVRKIEQMRELETVHQIEKHMPIVYEGVSPTIANLVQEVADSVWPVKDICYFPDNHHNGSSVLEKIGFGK